MEDKCAKVWLSTGSLSIGWDLEELNKLIDQFNRYSWAPEADFFHWLSWQVDDGYDYQKFDSWGNRKD